MNKKCIFKQFWYAEIKKSLKTSIYLIVQLTWFFSYLKHKCTTIHYKRNIVSFYLDVVFWLHTIRQNDFLLNDIKRISA
jgi:hypothetical protein